MAAEAAAPAQGGNIVKQMERIKKRYKQAVEDRENLQKVMER